MEESGENWPSDSDLKGGDYVKDFCFDDEEIVGDDDEGHSLAETVDPMMLDTDRKGRHQRELPERLLALLATMPGLKKMDGTSILDKARNYVKQLKQRVRELEQEVESHIRSNKGTASCGVNSGYYCGTNEILPEVKARVLEGQVLVKILCKKQKDTMLKILTQLENLHLSVVNSSVLRFDESSLDITVITIVAQMGDGYNMTVDELVKTLRIAILTE